MFVFLRYTYSEPLLFSLDLRRYKAPAAGTARRAKKVRQKARGISYHRRRAPRRGASRAARTSAAAAAARARPRSARHDRRGFLKPGRPTAARLFSLVACSPVSVLVSRSLGLPVSRCLSFAAVSRCRSIAASRSLGRIAAQSLARVGRAGTAEVASVGGAALRITTFLFIRLVSRAVGRRQRTITHRRPSTLAGL